MNGKIGVESTVGKGSVFWIELDLTELNAIEHDAANQKQQAESHATDSENRNSPITPTQADACLHTLLYVEDNPANLMLIEDIIARRPDVRLLSAMNARQGVKLARHTLPNVILMDINLPGLSGFDALKMLTECPETAHIPVVALSANAMPRDIEKGLEAGFFRYLTKPIKVNEFLSTLDLALKFAETKITLAIEKEQI